MTVGFAGALVLLFLLLCITRFRLLLRIAAAHDTSPWTLLGLWVERSAVVRAGVRTARAGHWLWAHLPVLPCMRWGCDVPVVWERICRRANKEPTEGPPDVLRRPFVGCGARSKRESCGAPGRRARDLKGWGNRAAAWGGRGLSLSAEAGLLSGQPEREVDAVSEA